MTNKIIHLDNSARLKIKEGIDLLAKTVGSTLGPHGKSAILEEDFGDSKYKITKDGISVARSIKVEDPVVNAGISLAREAAAKTNSEAGDGTTTATILAGAIYAEGLNYTLSTPINLTQGLENAVQDALTKIDQIAQPAKIEDGDIKKIAKISANGDEDIAESISQAFSKVGADGAIIVEESNTAQTTVELMDGTQFPSGYHSPYFVNDIKTLDCVYENPAFIITDKKITNSDMQDIIHLIGTYTSTTRCPIVVIADDFDQEIVSLFITNKLRGQLDSVLIKLPAYGENKAQRAQDLADITNGILISETVGMTFQQASPMAHSVFGTAKKIIVSSDKTTIIGGAGANSDKIIDLRADLEEYLKTQKEGSFEYNQARSRLNYLKGGIGIIKVGASTEAEMKEKRDRVDDAVNAAKAALKEGIVPGAGITMLRVSRALSEMKSDNFETQTAYNILAKALRIPFRTLFKNADRPELGYIVEDFALKTNDEFKAFDLSKALTQETVPEFKDAKEIGVIDPAKVLKQAIRNATSIASLLLSTNVVVVKDPADKPDQPSHPMM